MPILWEQEARKAFDKVKRKPGVRYTIVAIKPDFPGVRQDCLAEYVEAGYQVAEQDEKTNAALIWLPAAKRKKQDKEVARRSDRFVHMKKAISAGPHTGTTEATAGGPVRLADMNKEPPGFDPDKEARAKPLKAFSEEPLSDTGEMIEGQPSD